MIEFIGIYPSTVLKPIWINHGPIWEIFYCMEGRGTMIYEGSSVSYSENEFIIQTPNVAHYLSPDSRSRNLYLMVTDEYPMNQTLHMKDTPTGDILSLMMMLYRLSVQPQPNHGEMTFCLLDTIICYIKMLDKAAHPPVVEQMISGIIKNISNPDFKMKDLYGQLYMCEDTARMMFQSAMGCTPHEYLTRLRIQQACRIFGYSHGKVSVTETAMRVGILDPQYFSRIFKQKMGQTPNEWIRANISQKTERNHS